MNNYDSISAWIWRVDRWPAIIIATLRALSDALDSVRPSESADPADLAAHVRATAEYLTARHHDDPGKGRYALKRLARLIIDGQASLAQVRALVIQALMPAPTKDHWLLAQAMQAAGAMERDLHLPLLVGPVGAVVHARWGRAQACSVLTVHRPDREQLLAAIRSLHRASSWIRLRGFFPHGRFPGSSMLITGRSSYDWMPVFAKMAEAEATLSALESDPRLLRDFKRSHNLAALRANSPEQRNAADRMRIEAIVYQDRNAALRTQAPSARQVFRPSRRKRSE